MEAAPIKSKDYHEFNLAATKVTNNFIKYLLELMPGFNVKTQHAKIKWGNKSGNS